MVVITLRACENVLQHFLGDLRELLRPLPGVGLGVLAVVAGCGVAQNDAADPLRVPDRVLKGDVTAVGAAGDHALAHAQLLAQGLQVRYPLLASVGWHGDRDAAAARVVRHHLPLVSQVAERRFGFGVGAQAGRAVQRDDLLAVAFALDVDPELHSVDLAEALRHMHRGLSGTGGSSRSTALSLLSAGSARSSRISPAG